MSNVNSNQPNVDAAASPTAMVVNNASVISVVSNNNTAKPILNSKPGVVFASANSPNSFSNQFNNANSPIDQQALNKLSSTKINQFPSTSAAPASPFNSSNVNNNNNSTSNQPVNAPNSQQNGISNSNTNIAQINGFGE